MVLARMPGESLGSKYVAHLGRYPILENVDNFRLNLFMQTWVKSISIQTYEVDGRNIFLQLWRQKCLKVDEITYHASTLFSKIAQAGGRTWDLLVFV